MAKIQLKGRYPQPLHQELRNIIDEFNGYVSLGDATDGSRATNLDTEYQVHTFGGTPDTEESISHTLGRVPVGFIPVQIDRSANVYADNVAGWSATAVLFKCDTASAVVTILLF